MAYPSWEACEAPAILSLSDIVRIVQCIDGIAAGVGFLLCDLTLEQDEAGCAVELRLEGCHMLADVVVAMSSELHVRAGTINGGASLFADGQSIGGL